MKRITLLLLLITSVAARAQNYDSYGLYKIRMVDTNKKMVIEVNPISSSISAKSGLTYYWYSNNQIHLTQGGYSGKLLNGQYTAFYQNNNLQEQGIFKKGLKDGVWKNWNLDGTLSNVANWKNGVLILPGQLSFWQKINVFIWGKNKPAADTLKKK